MEDLLVLVLVLGALGLALGLVLLVQSRRQAEPPFEAELPLPPEVRSAVLAAADDTPGDATNAASMVVPPLAAAPPPAAPEPEGEVEHVTTADEAVPVEHRPLSVGSHVPLVDALVGMQLPCDLSFLGTVQGDPATREVLAFVTEGHDPEDVGIAVATELERLGYELLPSSASNVLHAQRGDGAFDVTVHHPAGSVLRGKARAFPTAPAAAVVVELTRP